jgi:ABC-type transport system involved in cytochrome c biogenesis permease subunit
MSYLGTIAFALLIASAAIQAVFLLRPQRRPASLILLLASAVLLLAITAQRSIQIRFPAVTNTYESLLFFAAVIALVLVVYRLTAREKTIPFVLFGGTIVAVAMLAIASSPVAAKEVVPPIPALQSYWLVAHVTLAFIGESFFVVAFISSIYYLATKDEEKKKRLDRLTYTSIGIGYPIFTTGALIFGAIWAETAWGNYWSWDPKETWALITWLVYTAYLHSRFVKRLRGRVSAILSVVGFVFTLFTFFGVNYLLAGLHSYA